jgi:hypothetical protein
MFIFKKISVAQILHSENPPSNYQQAGMLTLPLGKTVFACIAITPASPLQAHGSCTAW